MTSQVYLQKPRGISSSMRFLIFLSILSFAISPTVSYAAFPGPNGKIAFESTLGGSVGQIYIMNPDGSGVTQLTFTSADNSYPEWSADGTKIVFESLRDGNHEIYRMNADGSGQTRLTNSSDIDNVATWSPDGSQIAFASYRDGNSEIYVMNADGSDPTRLTDHSANDTQPAWSPDGTKIAFNSDRNGSIDQIFVMNTDGSNVTPLTSLHRNGGAAWSPDSTKIAFHSDRECEGCGIFFDIYTMNADGSGQTRITDDPAPEIGPAWSPDGTQITYESTSDGDLEVYVMNADGTGQTNITNNSAVDFRQNWGPQPYNFTGFFQPVDNLPTLNIVNAGKAIPVKFSLSGFRGVDIFVDGYPASSTVTCGVTAGDAIEQTVTAGSSSLTYDSSTDQYIYTWKTEKSWSGTCRTLVVKLIDGTYHQANFRFK